MPQITLPTGVYETTATLADNVFINTFEHKYYIKY